MPGFETPSVYIDLGVVHAVIIIITGASNEKTFELVASIKETQYIHILTNYILWGQRQFAAPALSLNFVCFQSLNSGSTYIFFFFTFENDILCYFHYCRNVR